MPLSHWVAFVAASTFLIATPGPTMMLVVSYALSHGRRSAVAVVGGVAVGSVVAMAASMAGLGALLATSASLFTLVRWSGGAYLVYLGIKLWRTPVANEDVATLPRTSAPRMFAHAFAVTALNPKGIVFLVAFVPQFIVASQPFLEQVIVMMVTFTLLAISINGTYAVLANAARTQMRRPRTQRAVNRTGGSLVIGAGALAVIWR